MLFLVTAVTANMFHFGISFLVSWYVSCLKECVRRFVFPLQTGKSHQLYEASPKVTTKKAEAGGTRMEKQSGVCGYTLVAIIKFVNVTERFGLGIIIGCVTL